MQVFHLVVDPFVLPMIHSKRDLAFRRRITLRLISDDYAVNILKPIEKFAEKSLGGFLVTAALGQDIEHIAILINRY